MNIINTQTNKNMTTFLTLWLISFIGTLAIIPYLQTLSQGAINPLLFVSISALQNAVIIWLGLFFARAMNYNMRLLDGTKTNIANYLIKPGLIGGIIAGIAIKLFGAYASPFAEDVAAAVTPPAWQGLLASLYGSINEELIARLFVLSGIAWLLCKVFKKVQPSKTILWVGIIGAALAFGIGHLPAAAHIGPLSPLIILYILLGNGIGGVIFGWLYCFIGLEAAMLAHFIADIAIHVIKL